MAKTASKTPADALLVNGKIVPRIQTSKPYAGRQYLTVFDARSVDPLPKHIQKFERQDHSRLIAWLKWNETVDLRVRAMNRTRAEAEKAILDIAALHGYDGFDLEEAHEIAYFGPTSED